MFCFLFSYRNDSLLLSFCFNVLYLVVIAKLVVMVCHLVCSAFYIERLSVSNTGPHPFQHRISPEWQFNNTKIIYRVVDP